jgi:DNA-binding CsgD family transcriptional regulator
MVTGSGVAEREWLEFAADLMAAPLVELPAERIAVQLVSTFDAVGCAFSRQSDDGVLVGGIYPTSETFGGHRAEIEEWGVQHATSAHPILLYYRATGLGGLIQVADVPERVVDRRVRDAWYDRARPWGCADQLAMPVLLRPGGHRAFALGRDRPFSAAELEFGTRVWQLLTGLDRQVQAFGRLRPVPDIAHAMRLTPRELTVLALLVEGLTAGAIGRRLTIGERTVQKHLEHAYTKLGVGDRLSAVMRAQHLGLLPAPAA